MSAERKLVSLHENPEVAARQKTFIETAKSFLDTKSGEEKKEYRDQFGQWYQGILVDRDKTDQEKSELFAEITNRVLRLATGEETIEQALPKKPSTSRKMRKPKEDRFQNFTFLPVLKSALVYDDKISGEAYKRTRAERELFAKSFFQDAWDPRHPFSPSVAAMCMRWAGYEALRIEPLVKTKSMNSIMALLVGSAVHWEIEKRVRRVLPREIISIETGLASTDPEMSGRMDFVYDNPKTRGKHLIELKTVSSFVFRKILREKLPDYLKTETDLYPLNKIEHRLQTLMYLWDQERQGNSFYSANVIYINKDSGQFREAFLLWDDAARYEAQIFIEEMRAAQKHVGNTLEPPMPTVTAENKAFTCGVACPYRLQCEYAKGFVAKRLRRRDIPLGVRKQAKRQAEIVAGRVLGLGAHQTRMSLS